MRSSVKHREYWRKNLALTTLLLLIWFVVTFVASYFARELNGLVFLGFPFGFYMAAQGALIVYVLIVWYYARTMNRLDQEYEIDEVDED